MAATLIDDVYDVLEGTLDEVLRGRAEPRDGIDQLVGSARVRDARCAVAMLSGLMRGGHRWRPAEDGHEASEWREILVGVHADGYQPAYRALVARELDELVALAGPGPRRPLPPGAFERLARRAGVRRGDCRTWARAARDDLARGWSACNDSRSLVRIPLALGVDLGHVFRALGLALVEALPEHAAELRRLLGHAIEGAATLDGERVLALRAAARNELETAATLVLHLAMSPVDATRLEHMLDAARRVLDISALRERLATPQMRARLASPGAN